MHCFKAPSPPTLLPGPFLLRSHSSPLRLSLRSSPRNPITWQNYEPEPPHSKALIPPIHSDTLYFAERPRGLRQTSYSSLNQSTFNLRPSPQSLPGKKRVESPFGSQGKEPRKRRIEWRKARNPILQDDSSFLPKPLKARLDWRPSAYIEGENWKRSGGTVDLWASAPKKSR